MTRFKQLTKKQRLDLHILSRVSDVQEILSSGEAELVFNKNDNKDTIGKLIQRALFHADGAVIKIRFDESLKDQGG